VVTAFAIFIKRREDEYILLRYLVEPGKESCAGGAGG
jgi:hypothetical protein